MAEIDYFTAAPSNPKQDAVKWLLDSGVPATKIADYAMADEQTQLDLAFNICNQIVQVKTLFPILKKQWGCATTALYLCTTVCCKGDDKPHLNLFA
tara:strand:+ start:636 stop:923 length:288 start_codon:yes stop_codon:yes gene_type:complete